ncbi:MAG: T9SS type A sorting domain-containing protein [Bacteroidetes bacterium]|nr:T9SS type A sorting domain-containing protein [Bacteroidota bacterium]
MIKKYLVPIFSAVLAVGNVKAQSVTYDSIQMGTSYTNQIFYDMATGQKGSASVKGWDIAHTTEVMDNCIRANHMTGMQVIHYKGSGNWSTFDTAGWKSWGLNYNDIHVHQKGAFNLYMNPPWGFGWGTYNTSSHEVVGDSMYLLAWFNGAAYTKFLKFEPMKQTVSGDFVFRFADVDGSNEVTDTLFQSEAAQQNYKYYNFNSKNNLVREPDKSSWDIAFNRYYEPIPAGPTVMWYPVMGVESNRGTKAAKIISPWSTVLSTDSTTLRDQGVANVKNDLTAIGSGWKYFDNGSFKWYLADTQSFIVRSVEAADSVFYLIHFTGFGGSADGKVVFAKTRLGKTNAVSHPKIGTMRVFPNPASNQIYVNLEGSHVNQITLKLHDLNGRELRSASVENSGSFSNWMMPVHGIKAGIYLLSIESGNDKITQQIIIQ